MQPPYNRLTDSIKQTASADLYYKRGVLLLQSNELDLAQSDMQSAWSLKKEEQYGLGVVAVLKKKNIDSALSFNLKAVQQVPGSIGLKISLAKGFQQKQMLNEALSLCNEVIASYPNQLDALQLKAEILTTQKKDTEALATLEKAYSYAPSDAELVHTLAFAYAQAKNAKAVSLCDSLIKVDREEKHAEPYYFKGVYFTNVGNKKEGLKFFDAAIQHDYNFLDAYMEKGNLLYDAKDFTAALKTFQLATTVAPTFAEAYYWLGKTKQALGNVADAKLDYQRAYGLDKTLVEARAADAALTK
jgi:tetratricopeptide (TPR) repeat protein